MATFNADKAVGEALAALRKERGLSQTEVAKRIGTSQVAVSNYEKGTRPVTPTRLYSLAEVYGTTASSLLPDPSTAAKDYLRGGKNAHDNKEN